MKRPPKYMHRSCGFTKYDKIQYCLYSHLDSRGSCRTDIRCRVFLMSVEEIKKQDSTSIFTATFTPIKLLVALSNGEIIDYYCDKTLI